MGWGRSLNRNDNSAKGEAERRAQVRLGVHPRRPPGVAPWPTCWTRGWSGEAGRVTHLLLQAHLGCAKCSLLVTEPRFDPLDLHESDLTGPGAELCSPPSSSGLHSSPRDSRLRPRGCRGGWPPPLAFPPSPRRFPAPAVGSAGSGGSWDRRRKWGARWLWILHSSWRHFKDSYIRFPVPWICALRNAKEQNFQLCNCPNPAKLRVRAIMLTALGGMVQGFPHYFQQASGNLAFFFFRSLCKNKWTILISSPPHPLVSSFTKYL